MSCFLMQLIKIWHVKCACHLEPCRDPSLYQTPPLEGSFEIKEYIVLSLALISTFGNLFAMKRIYFNIEARTCICMFVYTYMHIRYTRVHKIYMSVWVYFHIYVCTYVHLYIQIEDLIFKAGWPSRSRLILKSRKLKLSYSNISSQDSN
jgi:hypothetical protein